jgi:L-ascorbate metabolism protein UlaG (beta-lactamase superfamily)
MPHQKSYRARAIFFSLLLASLLFTSATAPDSLAAEKKWPVSDHFNGKTFFNPHVSSSSYDPSRSRNMFGFAWRWFFKNDQPEWPETAGITPAAAPAARVDAGEIKITTVGHATFLIQMDGVNILTDPIWSARCSPVSWAGPKRHKPPGLQLENLPPIDLLLISHNHYDHLDIPTLKRLAARGAARAIVPLGDYDLVHDAGIRNVEEMDWWQSTSLSSGITITMVPAQHFSMRTPWDRNKTLWAGFVISGPSGNVYFSGDTGYGPHFREIARRFAPIRAALLPIAPFQPKSLKAESSPNLSVNHMGPDEAVQAHIDLQAQLSIAAHFQVFQLGWDRFDDSVNELALAMRERGLAPAQFRAPSPGQVFELSGVAGKKFARAGSRY